MTTSRLLRFLFVCTLCLPVASFAGLFPQPVRCVFEYITDSTPAVWFDYDNKFSSAPQSPDQPADFQPSRHTTVYSGNLTNDHLAWKLDDETLSGGRKQKPAVTLTAPADGATFIVGTPITLTADPDGTVTMVEFFAGLVKLGEDTAAPWTFIWTTASAGSHVLTVWAIDNAGATSGSAPRIITVQTGANHNLVGPTNSKRGARCQPHADYDRWAAKNSPAK